MAALHFFAKAAVLENGSENPGNRHLSLAIEVEGSAPIKSRSELLRAAREISAEEVSGCLAGDLRLADFVLTETKTIDKSRENPLRSPQWPGVFVWQVQFEETAAD